MSKKSIFYTTADLNYSDVSPTLDLNFVENQKVPPFVNVTRNSQTTYVDKFGILRTADINQPVFEWDPITGKCLGARIWGAVTNRLLNSSTSGGVSISSGTTNGPNNQVMRKAVPAAGSQSFPGIGQGIETPLSLSSGQTVDVAIGGWFAAGSSGMAIEPRLVVDFFTSPNSNRIYAELQINTSNWTVRSKGFGTGVTEVTAPVITQYSPILFPGVYRVDWVVRYTQGATTRDRTSSYVQLRDSTGSGTFTADGIGHFQFFGLQSTLSSMPQPYVPTTTTTASSTADVWSITGADLSRIINQTEGTIYIEYGPHDANTPASNNSLFTITTSTTSAADIVEAFAGANVAPVLRVESNSVNQAYITSSNYNPSAIHKLAAAYKVDDFARSLDTQSIGTDTSGALPAVAPSILEIGTRNFGGVKPLNGYIRRLTIYPKRLTNSQLVQLTE